TGMTPSDAVYDPRTGRCIVAGSGPGGMALYQIRPGPPRSVTRLGDDGPDAMIADLALSPDGRYLLFRSNSAAGGSRPPARPPRRLERGAPGKKLEPSAGSSA